MMPTIEVHVAAEKHAEDERIDLDRLVACLEMKENGKWESPGGKLCITPATWHQYTGLPYRLASNRYQARIIAKIILLEAQATLRRYDAKPSVYLLAMRWRWGMEKTFDWLEGRAPLWVKEYPQEVANLYQDKAFTAFPQ